MQISINMTSLFVSTLLTGLTAGLCFTWANAITPGIGRLNDLTFLQSFQAMNRAILNPTFIIIFMGPFFVHLANIFLFRSSPSLIFWLILSAAILYIGGLILVTIFGNVPLNEMLDKVNLTQSSPQELHIIRDNFESKWNAFHRVRTISSSISFILLIISIFLHNK